MYYYKQTFSLKNMKQNSLCFIKTEQIDRKCAVETQLDSLVLMNWV